MDAFFYYFRGNIMKDYVIHTKERYYQHMRIKKLENIIRALNYYGFDEDSNKLIKILDKKINRRYSQEMNIKEKARSYSKYKKRGRV